MSAADAEAVSALHNRLAGHVTSSIVRPVLEAGGAPEDVCVLLESVIVGVMLALNRLGGDEVVLDVVVEGARRRLAEIRLRDIRVAGSG